MGQEEAAERLSGGLKGVRREQPGPKGASERGGSGSGASPVSVIGRLQGGVSRGPRLALATALCLSVSVRRHGRLCLLFASLWLCVGRLPP